MAAGMLLGYRSHKHAAPRGNVFLWKETPTHGLQYFDERGGDTLYLNGFTGSWKARAPVTIWRHTLLLHPKEKSLVCDKGPIVSNSTELFLPWPVQLQQLGRPGSSRASFHSAPTHVMTGCKKGCVCTGAAPGQVLIIGVNWKKRMKTLPVECCNAPMQSPLFFFLLESQYN